MKIPALLTILILPLSLLAARPTNAQAAAPTFPIRAAFYYPWFPETWGPVSNRYTHYTPTLGYYNSSDAATIDDHIARMEYAGINVGIASWWGQGSKTDQRISLLLAEDELSSNGHGLRGAAQSSAPPLPVRTSASQSSPAPSDIRILAVEPASSSASASVTPYSSPTAST